MTANGRPVACEVVCGVSHTAARRRVGFVAARALALCRAIEMRCAMRSEATEAGWVTAGSSKDR